MCCRVFHCCCCINLQRGVQVLGVLLTILSIIGLISSIVSLTNTNTFINNCIAANSAQVNAPITSTPNPIYVSCDVNGNTLETVDTLRYWQNNYNAIIGSVVGFQVFYLLIHAMLAWGATTGNRCLLLPYLISTMLAIVLTIIAIIIIIVGCTLMGWMAYAGGYIALSLLFPTLAIVLWIYFFIVVKSLFKQFGEESSAVVPMGNENWARNFYNKHI